MALIAVTGYGGSWLALRLVPGAAEAVRKAEQGSGMSSGSSVSPDSVGIFGDTPAGMLAAAPHSEATLSRFFRRGPLEWLMGRATAPMSRSQDRGSPKTSSHLVSLR
ncbi:hypothetical protein ACIP6X_42820 [Streptomyces coeruleorubidus]|uniref:hypothetical protein n=1 Tax=Streptomyces coeruleorubidus TaxID=116188 RepID=UPI003802744D